MTNNWFNKTVDETVNELKTNEESGLTTEEVNTLILKEVKNFYRYCSR